MAKSNPFRLFIGRRVAGAGCNPCDSGNLTIFQARGLELAFVTPASTAPAFREAQNPGG